MKFRKDSAVPVELHGIPFTPWIPPTGWVGDFGRSTTTTRLYLARRIGGCPVDFHWEVEAVRLVPVMELPRWLTNPHDAKPVAALLAHAAARRI